MKIIGHNLSAAIALFLILVLGFVSTSTNAMKLQFQSGTEEEQKGEADKYATVYKSGPSTPTEPPHNGRRPPGPGGAPMLNANAILQRKELFVQSQSSRKEEKEEVNYMHVFKSGPSTPTEPPHNRLRPPPAPHGNSILQMKELHVQSHSSRKEEEKGEVNYMHVFKSGPSTPTEPPHNRRRPPPPPHANAILQMKELHVQSHSSRKEVENYMHVFKSGPSTPTEPPHNRRRPPPPPPPHANAILQMKELHVQSHSSRKEEENYMHVFKSGPSTPTEPPHNGRGPPPLPSSRAGVLNMQPRKFAPPSRPARNHNVIPPTPG